MRDILFRGKRVDNDKWVYGNYFIEERDIEDGFIWRDIPQIQQRYGDHYNYFDIVINTLGQYIGLKDKNGKEIYEGDIVKTPNGNVEPVVYWDNGFYIEHKGRYLDIYSAYEVIGNIYENAEILEVKHNE